MPKGIYDHKKNYIFTPKRRKHLEKVGFQKGCKAWQHPKSVITQFKKGQHKGKDNHEWKGEKVSYSALHWWLKREKGNPRKCEICGKVGEKINGRWNIDWANTNHKYRRNLKDYIGMCKKCHDKYDIQNGFRQPNSLRLGILNVNYERKGQIKTISSLFV
jgi:hypothetical protein